MKLSLAVALHLALVAVAAPTPLRLKRDDDGSPSADVASKIAYSSLKSAVHMMDLYDEDTTNEAKAKGSANTNAPDYGNTMPINMTPNTMATFPSADGKPASDGKTKGSQHPAPAEAGKEHAAASPSVSAAATPSSAAPSFTVGKPSPGEGERVEDKHEQASAPAASPSPSASAPAAPKKESMLESLPVVGSLSTVAGLMSTLSGA
ncbi:hypothetical protein BDW67DRAFT_188088 [Aspergillus spinulosporus]